MAKVGQRRGRQILNDQQGFTLIEMIVVMVLLGILAAAALPKFLDLKTDAGLAAASGVAGALSSAASINYAAKIANKPYSTISDTAACSDIAGSILQAAPPAAQITFSGSSPASGTCSTPGATFTCGVTDVKSSQSATATMLCTG